MFENFPINAKDFDGSVLVTGAGGCIGSWVSALLIKNGVSVVAFDLSEDKRRLKLLIDNDTIEKIKWIKGDITDTNALNEAVKNNNIQAIIHLAALQIPFCAADPVAGARVNVVGTVNIFETARNCGLKWVAYTSSIAAHGFLSKNKYKNTLYGAYKLCNENIAFNYLQDWNVPSIGFRPGIVYGVGRDQGMTSKTTISILAAAAGKSYTIPFSGSISALYTGEVASALVKAVSKDREGSPVFDMNGTFTTVEEWINVLCKIQSKANITVAGESLPFPFQLSDQPLIDYIGDYGVVDLNIGMKQTFDKFKELLSRGDIFFSEWI